MDSIRRAISELERLYRRLKSLSPAGVPGGDPMITAAVLSCPEHLDESGMEVGGMSIAAEHLACTASAANCDQAADPDTQVVLRLHHCFL